MDIDLPLHGWSLESTLHEVALIVQKLNPSIFPVCLRSSLRSGRARQRRRRHALHENMVRTLPAHDDILTRYLTLSLAVYVLAARA